MNKNHRNSIINYAELFFLTYNLIHDKVGVSRYEVDSNISQILGFPTGKTRQRYKLFMAALKYFLAHVARLHSNNSNKNFHSNEGLFECMLN